MIERALVAVVLSAMSTMGVQAEEITLSFFVGGDPCVSVRDTHVTESAPDTAFGPELMFYEDGCGSPQTDALLGFFGIFGDSANQIPPGSMITLATLTLHVPNSGSNHVGLHRMLQPWSEMDTWNSRGVGVDVDGCEAVVESDAVVPAGISGTVEVIVTASVAAWSTGASNYGWVVPRCTKGSADATGFSSSEEPNSEWRPRLQVKFRLPCPADITGKNGPNGVVDVDDLLEVINAWGDCQ